MMTKYSAFSVVLVLLLVVNDEAAGQSVGVVEFAAMGVTGTITFTQDSVGIRIESNLQGLRGNHGWHIHDFPVDQTVDPAVQCLGGSVGGHYDPLNRSVEPEDPGYAARCENDRLQCEAGDLAGKFGPLLPDGNPVVVDMTNSFSLQGQFSIIGRSVVIHNAVDGSNFECGTIRSQAEIQGAAVTLLQSSFIIPIAGTVYFRQVEGEEVQMWGKVYWTNDSPTTVEHNWHIHTLAPGEEYREAVCDTTEDGNILGHYDPFASGPTGTPIYAENCGPNRTSGCEVGDLTGKHARLTVAAIPSPYSSNAFFFTDNFLNLTGEFTVNNRSLAIHAADAGTPVVACAPLVMSENIVLSQYRVRDITLSQGSPFEDTVLTSANTRTATTLEDSAFNPLIQNCVESTADRLFTPYQPIEIPAPGVVTPDRYSLGDLQNRYSDLSGVTTRRLFDVPIYGAGVSITSLSLRAATADVSTCSALIPPLMGDNVIVAKASFSRVLKGAVYLVQEDFGFGQFGNTHVIVDTYYADSATAATTGHNWHVHMNPSPSSDMCAPAVGGHYNPYMVSLDNMPDSTNSNYRDDCSPRYQLRCESGDLTGKHGQLDISADGSARPTYTYVDSNVQLSGQFTVIGRTIAIHDIIENLPIFDCGTINRMYVSSVAVTIRTTPSDELRTSLTTILAAGIDGLDPTDILVLNQEVSSIGFGFSCVNISVRVLGPSPMAADAYAAMVKETGEQAFQCNGGSRSASITLQTSLLLPLILAGLYIMTLAKY